MIRVGRRYSFHGSHALPDVPGYEERHSHLYELKVEFSGGLRSGMVEGRNTDELDRAVEEEILDPVAAADGDIDAVFPRPTTVESLAAEIHRRLGDVSKVMISEDGERWGISER